MEGTDIDFTILNTIHLLTMIEVVESHDIVVLEKLKDFGILSVQVVTTLLLLTLILEYARCMHG